MRGMTSGLALMALATLACAPTHAAAIKGGADTALADPAPVPGTLDYQYASLGRSAPAPAAVEERAPPAPADSAPVARRVIDAAGAFDGYMRRAATLDAGYKDAVFVRKAVDLGAGYEAVQLQQGAIAYGALVALQDPMFVDAVNAEAPTRAARERLASEIMGEPASVLHLPGAHETAAHVADVLGRRGATLVKAGESVRAASRAIQKETWSRATIVHPEEQLKAVKAESAVQTSLAPGDADALFTDLVALRKAPGQSYAGAGRPTRAVAQSLALAALAVLGHADEEHVAQLEPLLSTGQGADCLKLAKLNLYQCLAVVGPQYEDMFCLGQHGLSDTGQCVVSTAGWSGPADAAPTLVRASLPLSAPRPAVAAGPASLAVPMALAAIDGPERTRAYAEPAQAAPVPVETPAAAAEPLVMARADARPDLPAYADVPRTAERGPDVSDEDDEDAANQAPPPRDTRYAAADDAYRPARRRYLDDRYSDERAPSAASQRYSWDPADGPPPATPPGWRRPSYGGGYGAPEDDR